MENECGCVEVEVGAYGPDQRGVHFGVDVLKASELWGYWLGGACPAPVCVSVVAVPDDVCAEVEVR